MITKCPHCNTKFKAHDDLKGRKTKCPKCERLFTIVEFSSARKVGAGQNDIPLNGLEICTSCKRTIGRLEKAYVFNDEIVCRECNEKLRSAKNSDRSTEAYKAKLEQLHKISTYLTLKRMKTVAIGALIFGTIAVGQGASLFEDYPINGILVLIGLFLLIDGSWLLVSPKPEGIIMHGVALFIVGLWNIGLTILALSAGAVINPLWGSLGILQIVWGCRSLTSYKNFAGARSAASNTHLLNEVEEIVRDIHKADAKSRSDLIAFGTTTFWGRTKWKARLLESYGIFTAKGRADVLLLLKDEVSLVSKGKVLTLTGKAVKIQAQLGKKQMNGTISPEHLERFETWRNAE